VLCLAACGYGGALIALILANTADAAESGQFDDPTAASEAAAALVGSNPIYEERNQCGENPLFQGKAAADPPICPFPDPRECDDGDVEERAACYVEAAALAWHEDEPERAAAREALERSATDLAGMADVTALSAALRFWQDARGLGALDRLRFSREEREGARRAANAALVTALAIDAELEAASQAGEPLRFGEDGIDAAPAEDRARVAHEAAHVVQQRLGRPIAATEDLDAWHAVESVSDEQALLAAEREGEAAVDQAVEDALASPGLDALIQLQVAINTQSQTNNMITNMQKARHDAMMATIQNTR
jgi:hypothetical protein